MKKSHRGRRCLGGKDRRPIGKEEPLCVEDNVDSPTRLIFGTPIASIGFSAVIAARVEMYTMLACRVHAPKYEPIGMNLIQPHSVSMNTTGTSTLDIPSIAHESVQPVTVYIPAPSEQHVPDRNQCASDPVVQAAVAQLSAGLFVSFLLCQRGTHTGVVLMTAMGVLSCLTTAWWGSVKHSMHVIDAQRNLLSLSSSRTASDEYQSWVSRCLVYWLTTWSSSSLHPSWTISQAGTGF
jgi:hypothetical protein